jgi:trans-aconitate 2-methyltransferase
MLTNQGKAVAWSPADYAAHSAVQQTWARELIAKLHLRGDERVLDVGCGDGKVTAEIARAVPRGLVIGVDASPQMIAFAQKAFPRKTNPNLTFQICDARKISLGALASRRRFWAHGEGIPGTPFDIVFSNAALHWVDDHQAFLRGAASVLKPGGRLMISCGGKGNAHDVFLALRPEMRTKRWRGFFRNLEKPYFFYRPDDYEKWLPRSGFKTHRVKLSPKDAGYPGRDGFTAWMRTTWLPYTQRVPEGLREEFLAAIVGRYLAKHPLDADSRIHVRMVRLEIDAVRA